MTEVTVNPQPNVCPCRVTAAGLWVVGVAGAVMWQFYGNANQGYIDTRSLFYWWVFQWFNAASETEHGPLILAVSAWLFWKNLAAARLPASEDNFSGPIFWRAASLLLLGLFLHFVGYNAQQARVSILALLFFAWGLSYLAGGRRGGSAAMFPLGFLIFAIPFDALDSAGFWLRLWVIRASALIAHAGRIGVLQNGTQLMAPDGKFNYDVAAACSGVRSLVALMALSLLVGYLNLRPNFWRMVVLLVSLPLVFLGNVLRIVSIIFAGAWGGQRWGERAHDVMGYGVFLIVLGGVILTVRLVKKFRPGIADFSPGVAVPRTPRAKRRPARGSPRATLFISATALVTVGAECYLAIQSSAKPRGRAGIALAADGMNPIDLPPFLGIDWTGRFENVTTAEREILPPDTGFSRRRYFNHHDPSRQVFFSVVLSGRDRTSIHRPELCLIGQGWTIRDSARTEFGGNEKERQTFPATILHVEHELPGAKAPQRIPQLVAYWFVGADHVAGGYWERLFYDAWNRMVHGRADRWAYILTQTNADDGDVAALARLRTVIAQVIPVVATPRVFGRVPEGR